MLSELIMYCNPKDRGYKKVQIMTMITVVHNLSTGEKAEYTLPPHEAVVAAHEGLTKGNWNTADYDMSQATVGDLTVSCGDWSALLPLGGKAKIYILNRVRKMVEQGVIPECSTTILYSDGPECPCCGRPRVWRKTEKGLVCGTGADSGRLMDPEEVCWSCRESIIMRRG